ncbi:hypothetical protein J6590_037947 [Homalodisca vitripennis]|nr:hypothetical protein J6590_037947 [Homalodisca vitripennis]
MHDHKTELQLVHIRSRRIRYHNIIRLTNNHVESFMSSQQLQFFDVQGSQPRSRSSQSVLPHSVSREPFVAHKYGNYRRPADRLLAEIYDRRSPVHNRAPYIKRAGFAAPPRLVRHLARRVIPRSRVVAALFLVIFSSRRTNYGFEPVPGTVNFPYATRPEVMQQRPSSPPASQSTIEVERAELPLRGGLAGEGAKQNPREQRKIGGR